MNSLARYDQVSNRSNSEGSDDALAQLERQKAIDAEEHLNKLLKIDRLGIGMRKLNRLAAPRKRQTALAVLERA